MLLRLNESNVFPEIFKCGCDVCHTKMRDVIGAYCDVLPSARVRNVTCVEYFACRDVLWSFSIAVTLFY